MLCLDGYKGMGGRAIFTEAIRLRITVGVARPPFFDPPHATIYEISEKIPVAQMAFGDQYEFFFGKPLDNPAFFL